MKRKSRLWVVRIMDHGDGARCCEYVIVFGKKPTRVDCGYLRWGSKASASYWSARLFHAASDIRLKPGGGPVELAWPLFDAKE